ELCGTRDAARLPRDSCPGRDAGERLVMSRFALMALGMLALVAGLGAGLVRIGWSLHTESIAMLHGPLMVCGFLGTLISLERAVALGRTWSFGGPLLVGAGGCCSSATPCSDRSWAGRLCRLAHSSSRPEAWFCP